MDEVYLAYDGSVNGDWVAHYAVRLAALSSKRRLVVLHVLAETNQENQLSEKINRIEKLCQRADVAFENQIIPLKGTVYKTLTSVLPGGENKLVVCGTRARSRRRGYLAGTISEQLLHTKKLSVMAVRVVQPGVLGAPESIIWPISDNVKTNQSIAEFISSIAHGIKKIHLFHVIEVHSFFYHYLSAKKAAELKRKGREFLQNIYKIITSSLGKESQADSTLVISDDWSKEILIYASKSKARLMILGVAQRRLLGRFHYGNVYEHILRETPCDVAIFHKAES